MASAARHDLDIWAYLYDVLERLAALRQKGPNRSAAGESPSADIAFDVTPALPDVWAKARIRKPSAATASTNARAGPRPNAPAVKSAAPWPRPKPPEIPLGRPSAYPREIDCGNGASRLQWNGVRRAEGTSLAGQRHNAAKREQHHRRGLRHGCTASGSRAACLQPV